MIMYTLYVRDQNFNRVAQIEDYKEFEMIMRFNEVGSWVMSIPTNCEAAREIIKPRTGIIVTRDDKTIFSGPVTGKLRKWDQSGDVMTLNGYDDMILLDDRIAVPVPSGPPYTPNDYDIRAGNAETIMKAFFDVNAGVSAPSERKSNALSAPNQLLGKSCIGKARFHTLLELFKSIAISGGMLGFTVVQVGNGLQFQVYQPTDKSTSAIFSPMFGNLYGFEYSIEDPETNYVYVGGGGVGKDRIIMEKGNSASIIKYRRKEKFIDKRDTTSTTELTQAMDEELAANSEKMNLSLSPIDTDFLTFGKDYNLGDKVAVILSQPDGSNLEKIIDVVREVKISLKDSKESITPVVGTPDSTNNKVAKIFETMKKLNKRISNLEKI